MNRDDELRRPGMTTQRSDRQEILQLVRVLMIFVGRNRVDNFRLGVAPTIWSGVAGDERVETLCGSIVPVRLFLELLIVDGFTSLYRVALERAGSFSPDNLVLSASASVSAWVASSGTV